MSEKYSCPDCGKELSEADVIRGICSSCHSLFEKPEIKSAKPVLSSPGSLTDQQPHLKASEPSSSLPRTPPPLSKTKIDLTSDSSLSSKYIGKNCPYCQTPIKPGVQVTLCPSCGIPHHTDCWNENCGCTTYGCDQNSSSVSTPRHTSNRVSNTVTQRFCPNCGTEIGEGIDFCPDCGTATHGQQNTSGQGSSAYIPPEIRGWNWGAFFLSLIWTICNNVWIGLLVLVPYLWLPMIFVLGAKGNEWAWQHKRWDSIKHFKRVQKAWASWGLILLFLYLLIVLFGISGI